MTIVLFKGKQGSGKTTAAKLLTKYYGFKKLSFADRIREISQYLYGNIDRKNLIAIGQMGRDLDPDTWVKQTVKTIRLFERKYNKIVIDDLRFPNELEYIVNEFKNEPNVRIYVYDIIRSPELRQQSPKYVREAENDVSETAGDLMEREYDIPKIINDTNNLVDYYLKLSKYILPLVMLEDGLIETFVV